VHGRRVLSRRLGTLLALAPALLLAGCGDGSVRAVPFEQSDSPACRSVSALWPQTVGGLEERVVAVQSSGVAAWGDPPIVARCGKQPPAPTTDPCIDIDGVDWVATELDDGTMFTTYGRSPAVEVLVPEEYDTAPLWLPPFGDAVRQVEQTLGACSSVGDQGASTG
jgi:hypothetical protein